MDSSETSRSLTTLFHQRWSENNGSITVARLARWRVLHWLLLQRLGFMVWAKARLFFGVSMHVLTGETVSGGLLAFGYAEDALTALMLATLRPGMTFVDIGAHFGYEAMLGSTLVEKSGHVVSFEPQPRIAAITRRNLSRFPQARLVEAAVGECEGLLELEDRELKLSAFAGKSRGGPSITVPMVALAGVLKPAERPVHFIKCDAEGNEAAILKGCLDLIREDQPLLVLEAEMPLDPPTRPRLAQLEAILAPLGYETMLFDFRGTFWIGGRHDFVPGHANVAFVPAMWRDKIAALGSGG